MVERYDMDLSGVDSDGKAAVHIAACHHHCHEVRVCIFTRILEFSNMFEEAEVITTVCPRGKMDTSRYLKYTGYILLLIRSVRGL